MAEENAKKESAAKAPKKDSNTVAIERYLLKRAVSDPELATKLKDPSKSIEGCMKYIKDQARKKAINGCAMIEDEVVYGWAMHYYDEASAEPQASTATTIKAEKSKKAEKQEEDKPGFVQLSLFD